MRNDTIYDTLIDRVAADLATLRLIAPHLESFGRQIRTHPGRSVYVHVQFAVNPVTQEHAKENQG